MEGNRKIQVAGLLLFLGSMIYSCKDGQKEKINALHAGIEEIEVPEEIKNEVMPVKDYMQWMQDPKNGFHKVKPMDDIEFVVQYKTPEFIICREERKETLSDSLVKRKQQELQGVHYFDLKIQLINGEGELLKHQLANKEAYENRVRYFAFEMQKDIQLVDGKDTLPCLLYHFERTYDVAPFCTILLGFNENKKNIHKPKTLLVYDKIFNKGLQKFTFKENKLQTLPKLQTI